MARPPPAVGLTINAASRTCVGTWLTPIHFTRTRQEEHTQRELRYLDWAKDVHLVSRRGAHCILNAVSSDSPRPHGEEREGIQTDSQAARRTAPARISL